MAGIDAIVMGRNTFETVCSFEGEWPFSKPVFVLSTTMVSIPAPYHEKAILVKGTLPAILKSIHEKGYKNLYIDGGLTIQSFLKEDLIDELIITTIPIVLGEGIPLFGEIPRSLVFEHLSSEVFLYQIVQSSYKGKRK
ncbi:dihydrofolate reductase [Arenibacter sp. 6A1]|uniref:dihydrofolate reductase family protein n=1 Tax=Arenibacter sp. 6A1 TaxID=2720391 RepID=UPI00144614C1|nr:dihydrofolate reductase family protein [Arenibacter sp. 6A1]NKI26964.1 dihydrofolate reductase [Arenibacter sp. 6A1]